MSIDTSIPPAWPSANKELQSQEIQNKHVVYKNE